VMMPFTIHGHDQSMLGRYHGVASWHSVSPGYFDVFRIRLLRGGCTSAECDSDAVPFIFGYSYGYICRKIKPWPLLFLPTSHPASANSPLS
jgi:hypothetical protein